MKTTLEVGPQFPPATKVAVCPRFSETAGKAIKSVTVGDDGTVSLDGLVEHAPYWLVGSVDGSERRVAFDAAGDLDADDPNSREGVGEQLRKRAAAVQEVRENSDYLRPEGHDAVADAKDEGVPEHNFEKSSEPQPTPKAKQADMPKGTPQRSSTPVGAAYPVDPDEHQPKIPQSAVKPGTPQRSDTPLGEATPVDPSEVQPGLPYEDQKGPQLQGATTGTAVPAPRGSKKEQEQAKDSALSAAQGATVAVAGTSKVKSVTSKSVKAKVKDPVKPAAKKAVRKGDES